MNDAASDFEFLDVWFDCNQNFPIVDTEESDQVSPVIEYTDYSDQKPYRCGCNSELKFRDREKFRRHMIKHGVVIPFKNMKRKVEELDSDITTKDFTRYCNNFNK